MPKSTSPPRTSSGTSSCATSNSVTVTPGYSALKRRMKRGTSSAACSDDAATETRPRPSVFSWLELPSTLSRSAIALRASGRISAPARVSFSIRVWRSNRRRPRLVSSSRTSVLTDDCERPSLSAARVKCSASATAMNARSWRSVTFMCMGDEFI